MRILSKTLDYYDGLAGQDRERVPVYLRRQKEVSVFRDRPQEMARFEPLLFAASTRPLIQDRESMFPRSVGVKEGYWPQPSDWGRHIPVPEVEIVAFCGDLHLFIAWEGRAYSSIAALLEGVRTRPVPLAPKECGRPDLWESERRADLQRILDTSWNEPFTHRDLPERRRGGFLAGRWTERFAASHEGFAAWEAEVRRQISRDFLVSLHREYESPVFRLPVKPLPTGVEAKIVFNPTDPNLGSLGFASLVPPAQAWQRIDMFFGNELAKQVDPLPLADEYRRDARGFDAYSFKNVAPGEKKARRRSKKS